MKPVPLKFYFDQPDHVPLKVDLFARIHEMQGISEQLIGLDILPPHQKKLWLKEHETYLRQILEQFANRLPVQFDQNLDTQTMQLLCEYTTNLQQMVSLVHHILNEPKVTT